MAPSTRARPTSESYFTSSSDPSRPHPRRKSSVAQARRRLSSINSQNALKSAVASQAPLAGADKEQSVPTRVEAWRASHHLRDVAFKVGDEVDKFAERLDAWRNKLSTAKDTNVTDLVRDFRAVAGVSMRRVKKDASSVHTDRLANKWRQKIDPTVLDLERDADDQDIAEANKTLQELQAWQGELNTWRLFEDLVSAQHQPREASTPSKASQTDRFAADGASWHDFLANEPEAQKRYIVLNWLEEIAERDGLSLENIQAELQGAFEGEGGLPNQGWLDTRETLKARKRQRTWDVDHGSPAIQAKDGTPLVYHLDPDSPARLQRKLEYPDQTVETLFWMMCWEMFRRGSNMREIRSLCDECNELARAAMIGASAASSASDEPTEAGAARYRWRSACRSAASRLCHSEHERAVLGFLSGDFKTVEPVCESWEDLCFAHFNTQLLAQYRAFVKPLLSSKLPHDMLHKFNSQFSPEQDRTTTEVIDSIRSHPLVANVNLPEHALIQQRLIADDLVGLLVDCGIAVSHEERRFSVSALPMFDVSSLAPGHFTREAPVGSEHSLRFLAHAFIALKAAGVQFASDSHLAAAENVLIAYMDVLLLAQRWRILPIYVAALSNGRALPTMAAVLTQIQGEGLKRDQLRLMEHSGFEVSLVISSQYQTLAAEFAQELADRALPFQSLSILERTRDTIWPGHRVQQISKAAEGLLEGEKILKGSLKSIALMRGRWFFSFGILNDAVLRFMSTGRYLAAIDLIRDLVPRTIVRTKTLQILGSAYDLHDDFDLAESGSLMEEDDDYVGSAEETSNKDEQISPDHKREAMRQQSSIYVHVADICEALFRLWEFRHLANAHVGRRSGISRDDGLRESLEQVKLFMFPLLQPGFLTSASATATFGEAECAALLARIREAYLPELVLAYQAVLHCGGHLISSDCFVDCLELAETVASNEELTRCFVATGRMRELMDSLAASSKAILRVGEKKRKTHNKLLGIWDVHP